MHAIHSLVHEHYAANRDEVKLELELRHGEVISASNQLTVNAFELRGEDYAVILLSDIPVIFVTVDWGEPSVKFTYIC